MLQNPYIKAVSKSIHFWLPVAAFGVFFLLLDLLHYVNTGNAIQGFDMPGLLREGWLVIVQLIVTLYFIFYSIQFFDRKFQRKGFSIRYYIYEMIFVLVIGFLINGFFHLLFATFIVVPEDDVKSLEQRMVNLQEMMQILLLMMYGLMTGFRIFKNLQQKQMEVLQWQKEFAQTQFEALKNQLNPHFLFNSLSVLTSLVYADADKAEEFIEKLSRTYRYLLDQREKEAVKLSLELEFLKNFRFLTEQRYGNKLQIAEQVQHDTDHLFILPHTLLVLMEYIIGSNTMSSKKPLHIEVTVTPKALFIRHSLQPKDLQTAHLLDQYNSLKSRYADMKKSMEESADEISGMVTIKILLFNLNDKQ